MTSNLTGYVPYTGATTDLILGNNNFSSKRVSVLKSSDGYSGFTSNYLFLQTGSSTTTVGTDGISLLSKPNTRALVINYDIAGTNYAATLDASLLTNGRTYNFPDASGTLALVGSSGIGTVTSIATAGTVSGLSLTGGTITTTGTITLGGTLSLTAANVNAVGAITNSTSGNAATASYATTAGSVDFNNLTNKTGGTGTYQTSGDFRAPYFYDSNNTSYYGDFAGQSSMYGVAIRTDIAGATDSGSQLFLYGSGNTTTSAIGFKNGGAFPNPTGNGDGWNTFFTMDTVGRGWVFRRGTGGTDFSAAYTSGWILNNGIWQANASMRSPIFYDSDDTTYYLDMNSTSDTAGKIRGGILFGPNTTWGAYLRVGGNGDPDTSYANVAATNGNLHLDSKAGYAMYLNHYANGIIYLNGSTYYISANGSQYNGNAASATYATSAGSAPNASNANAYYNVTPGTGYGLKFWSSDSYKISMGASALYYYGPVTDYSIKMQMDDGSAGRGFTWGRESYAPIAGLNGTSGNMQIAGTFTSTAHYITGSTNGGYIYSNDWGIKMANNNGYIQFGPANGSWSHIYSDKSFYFNQELYVNNQQVIHSGNIGSQSVSYASTAGSAGSVTGASTMNGYLTVSANWAVSPYTSAFTIIGTYPSMTLRNSTADYEFLMHSDAAGDLQYYFGPGYTINSWTQRYTFGRTGNFEVRTGTITASGDITAYSDIRVKENIEVIENALEKIQAIRGVTFNRTDLENDKGVRHAGVIAQEVLEVLPEVVKTNDKGMYSVAYGNITALLIEGVKEQQLLIASQRADIEELKRQINYIVENK